MNLLLKMVLFYFFSFQAQANNIEYDTCLNSCRIIKESYNESHHVIYCEEYCHLSMTEEVFQNIGNALSSFIPLNDSEVLLIGKHPVLALKAFFLSRKAYQLCENIQEKDACQHFT